MNRSKNLFLGFLFTLLILVSITVLSAADTNTTGTNVEKQDVTTYTVEPVEKAASAQVTENRKTDNKIKTTNENEKKTKKTVKNTTRSLKQETDGTFTQLQQEIDKTTDTLTLTQNYTRKTGEKIITINKNMIIDGKGCIINANKNKGIFNITEGNVILKNMTLTWSNGESAVTINKGANVTEENMNASNNKADDDGGVNCNEGNLTINNGIFTNNNATNGGVNFNMGTLTIINGTYNKSYAENGGITYNEKDSELTIKNTDFTGNYALNCGGVNYNLGKVTIDNSTFINNTATKGGVNYIQNGTATINNTTFKKNKADYGGVNYNLVSITIANTTFINNTATKRGGVNYNENQTLIINNATCTSNTAVDNGGVNYIQNGTLIMTNGIYTQNKITATYIKTGGGVNYIQNGTLNITHGTYTGNTVPTLGGVNYIQNGTTTINNTTFIQNNAGTGGVTYNENSNMTSYYGTYIKNTAKNGGITYNLCNLTINKGNYTNNLATSFGGVTYNTGNLTINNATFTNNTARFGGVTYHQNGILTIDYTTSTNNTADDDGGVNYIQNGTTIINNSTFTNNNATNRGGAIYNNATLTVSNTTFTSNTAGSGGGAIYNNATLTDNNSTFTSNSANNGGGGGAICNNATAIINNGNYTYNTASGGGVHFNSGNLTIKNGTYTNNSANTGGAINTNIGTLIINNATFINTTSENSGGVIYNTNSKVDINNTLFTNSTATSYGGTIYNSHDYITKKDTIVTIINSTFTNSNAGEDAGVIYNYYSTLTIKNSTFRNNTAGNKGGVTYNSYSNITLTNGTYSGNTAQRGGVFYNINSTLIMKNGTYDSNTAQLGGVVTNFGNLTINNGNYTNNTGKYTIESRYIFSVKNSLFKDNKCNNTLFYEDIDKAYIENISNNVYTGNNLTTSMNITPFTSKISTRDEIDFTITVKPHSIYNTVINTGSINFYEDDKEALTVPVTNGEVAVPYTPNPGKYNLTMAYDDKTISYTPINKTSAVNIIKNTKLNITILNKTYGNTTLSIGVLDTDEEIPTLLPNAQLKITLENSTIVPAKTDENGIAVSHLLIPGGTHYITISYYGNSSYYPTVEEIPIYIEPCQTVIRGSILNETATNTTIKAEITDKGTGKPVTTGTVIITDSEGNIVGNKTVEEDGTVTITTNITNLGKQTITLKYQKNENYTRSTDTLDINVTKIITKITIDPNTDIKAGDNITINVTLKDVDNRALSNKPVTLTINGLTKTLTTDTDGIITYIYTAKTAMTISLTAKYDGNDIYTEANTTDQIEVTRLQTFITLTDITTRINDTTTIKVKITDERKNNVIYGRIILKLNGKTLKDSKGNIISEKIENGTATIITSFNQKPGLYPITAVYGGHPNYEPSRNADTILAVTPRDAQLTIVDMPSTITTQNEVSFKITVTDENTQVNTGRIIIKINGKTLRDSNGNIIYTAVTDGTADVKFTLPNTFRTKNYTLTAVYGDKSYNRAENTTQTIITNPLKTENTNMTTYTVKDNTPKTVKI